MPLFVIFTICLCEAFRNVPICDISNLFNLIGSYLFLQQENIFINFVIDVGLVQLRYI
jgi:hypothetical protein